MQHFDQEKVSARFSKLPEVVQDVILSEEVKTTLGAAMLQAGLQGERKRECNHQATLVLVGLSKTTDFEDFVRTELRLDEARSAELIDVVNTGIFLKVQKVLVDALEAHGGDKTAPDRISNLEKKDQAPEHKTVDPYKEPIS